VAKHGRIAFITTPHFRADRAGELQSFVFEYMYALCQSFDVLTTGGTYETLKRIVGLPLSSGPRFESDHRSLVDNESALEHWQSIVMKSLKPTMPGVNGMIHVAYELVEGRLDAVLHFADWQDKSAKPDSAVLAREANVHKVPIAHDVDTAGAYVRSWSGALASAHPEALFCQRESIAIDKSPIFDLKSTDRVIAMIAHDNMKLEICRFAIENASYIFNQHDYVLATGTTGDWILKFMEAAHRGAEARNKIRLCRSGPKGGDLQIAYAVAEGLCQQIIFLQDPSVNHPHDSDIQLFEQAVATHGVHARLATNVESARFLITSVPLRSKPITLLPERIGRPQEVLA